MTKITKREMFEQIKAHLTNEAEIAFIDHELELLAKKNSYKSTKPTKTQIAAAGEARQRISGKKVGEVSVTYAAGASSSSASASTDLADLTETDFGMQLLSLMKLYCRSVYVP